MRRENHVDFEVGEKAGKYAIEPVVADLRKVADVPLESKASVIVDARCAVELDMQ
ncbi:hypothetical protein [Trinickia mobilis]|uniref:hypothetical protein n=1 Tax=Trinickia mobilis TaxID=2816356 RepID=UPI001F5D1CDE|nr:hypothetical protein [Trinickia mobilis]